MRRSLFTLALVASMSLFACSEQPTEPPREPEAVTPDQTFGGGPAFSCTPLGVLVQIIALVPRHTLLEAVKKLLNSIPSPVDARNRRTAQEKALAVVDFILRLYYQGDLVGGQSPETQEKVLKLINSLYCLVKLPPITFPLGALGPDAAVAVVTPNSERTLIVTGTENAGLDVQARSVTEATTIVISRLPDSPGPLLTSLNQFPLFYQFTSFPEVTFTLDAIAGVCVADDPGGDSDLRVAHNVGPNFGDIEVLPPAAVPFLDCDNLGASSSAGRDGSGRFDWAKNIFLPAELHASSAALVSTGVGGTTRTFSPFGAVDINSNPGRLNYNPNEAAFGSLAALPGGTVTAPSVRVRSENGVAIANVPVVFRVTSGGGTLNGGASTVTVTSGADGIASLSSWTLGASPGINTVSATAPDIDQVGTVAPFKPAAEFAPPSLTFTATAAGPIDYLTTGYRYLLSTSFKPGDVTAFAGLTYKDIGWSTGDAAFGFDGGNNCALNKVSAGQKTKWPANTQILLRKPFSGASGITTGTVSVAIDNDIRVFVNGVEITGTGKKANGHPVALDANGFVRHEGCATRGSFTFKATNLTAGVNLLAIRGRDRGSSTYVDAKVTLGSGGGF
ncbi:MAG: hypothetical protein ACREMX_03105 [Gemmatimonadales bacterium]